MQPAACFVEGHYDVASSGNVRLYCTKSPLSSREVEYCKASCRSEASACEIDDPSLLERSHTAFPS